MFNLQKLIPVYITEKSNIVRLIFYTAIFALVFINIYAPFDVKNWFPVNQWLLLAYSSAAILTGVLVVVISRVLMYTYNKKHPITYQNYIIWVMAELFFMSIFYTLFEKFFLKDPSFILDLFKISAQNTALILLLPYATSWLYFSWQDKTLKLDQFIQGQPLNDSVKNMVPFFDEKGILRLSLLIDNLLYVEAADNYVNVFYLNKEKVTRFMLRNSLKRLESIFKGTEVIRCHRSYMVNFKKVRIIRKDKDGLMLEFDLDQQIDLPVSKSFVENVMSTFMKYCRIVE